MSPYGGARIAFYSHDTLGLGHMRRCLKIAEAIEDTIPGASGMMLSGSPWSSMLAMPAAFQLVSLEPVRKLGPGLYRPRTGTLDITEVLLARSRRLQEELLDFGPDLLVVDNVPCGLKGELLPALRRLRRRGCRVALSLRDVLDDDASMLAEWNASGALEALARLRRGAAKRARPGAAGGAAPPVRRNLAVRRGGVAGLSLPAGLGARPHRSVRTPRRRAQRPARQHRDPGGR